jgi:hypothetical protein
MAGNVTIVFDHYAVKQWADHGLEPQAALDLCAGLVVNEMKRLCPVSPTQRVYASGGAVVSGGSRKAGDFPLRPSGFLRNSIAAFRQPDGAIIIGPTAPYGRYVNNGTPPHAIDSHGSWPLRNRATGQVFGKHVNHPGTPARHFVEASAEVLRGVHIRV